jgi:multimeric flavodoxin WrbA
MKELMLKFINSDLVVMAIPVYVDNVTAIMKMFLERLVPFW